MTQQASVPTFGVQIWMAGDAGLAKQICREFCFTIGLCVTVTPTDFIYTGGEEAGFVVGIINYPRFPKESTAIMDVARELAQILMVRLYQHSYSIVNHEQTEWFSRRPGAMA